MNAMAEKPVILAVDDTPLNLELIMHHMAQFEEPHILETADSGEVAWKMLEENPERYDVILLDWMMPNMDGIQVLEKIREHPLLKRIPVIMQTAKAEPEDLLEGLEAGAYHYLTKPFNEELILTVVKTALRERMQQRALHEALSSRDNSVKLLTNATFKFKSIIEANSLAILVANVCPNPNDMVTGLSELLINSIEHGNLGIHYDLKSELKATGSWEKELFKRMQMPLYMDRVATLEVINTEDEINFVITDEGEGFDWRPYMDFAPERMLDSHGRGIAVANKLCFSSVEYRDKGNIVSAIVRK